MIGGQTIPPDFFTASLAGGRKAFLLRKASTFIILFNGALGRVPVDFPL
jgi:hypothetical protein